MDGSSVCTGELSLLGRNPPSLGSGASGFLAFFLLPLPVVFILRQLFPLVDVPTDALPAGTGDGLVHLAWRSSDGLVAPPCCRFPWLRNIFERSRLKTAGTESDRLRLTLARLLPASVGVAGKGGGVELERART